MIRVVLDQGLPYTAAGLLRAAGWDVVHVAELGMHRATDQEIIHYARRETRIIATLDSDFHALLAVSGLAEPSIIRVRQEGLRAEALVNLLTTVWPRIGDALFRGALVTIDDRAIRVRLLPIT